MLEHPGAFLRFCRKLKCEVYPSQPCRFDAWRHHKGKFNAIGWDDTILEKSTAIQSIPLASACQESASGPSGFILLPSVVYNDSVFNDLVSLAVVSMQSKTNMVPSRLSAAALIVLLLSIGFSQLALAQKRIALVIGNSDYKDVPLTNPVNDAEDISAALRETGFDVYTYTNVNRKQMREAIRVFGDNLRQADVGLFYFAGHGIQIKGRNYLVPLAIDVRAADEVQDESIDASAVLRKMESAGNAVNIVILDACRNNPFARSFRSLDSGLARMEGPVGSFIAYATAPGSVAADGEGRNGVYTSYLLKALRQPGLTIEQVFKQVRIGVKEETSGMQIPWESSSLMGDFVFLPTQQSAAVQAAFAPPTPPPVAMRHLQVITNVPNASVIVNNVNRGMISNKGVLNIANLNVEEADVTVQAQGYAPLHQRVKLKAGQWEQLQMNLQPKEIENPKMPEPSNTRKAQNSHTNCGSGKRVLFKGKIIIRRGNEKKIMHNIPMFKASVIQSLSAYGLDFIDVNEERVALADSGGFENLDFKELAAKQKLDYLLKAVIDVRELPIKLLKTNFRTVNSEIILELLDVATNRVLASSVGTFTQAGTDPRKVLRTQLKRLLPGMSAELMNQTCNKV